MYGAILGDMIGALYEFDRGNKSKEFEMFNDRVCFLLDGYMIPWMRPEGMRGSLPK